MSSEKKEASVKCSRKWAFTTTQLDVPTEMESSYEHVLIGPTEYGVNPHGHRHGQLLLKGTPKGRPNVCTSIRAIKILKEMKLTELSYLQTCQDSAAYAMYIFKTEDVPDKLKELLAFSNRDSTRSNQYL